jgi:hypothetical protein
MLDDKPPGRMRHIVTLRARSFPVEPKIGQLMASESGRVVYRIVRVTKIKRAGDPLGHCYRIVCTRLRKCEVPADSTVLPWFRTSNPRRPPVTKPRRAMVPPAPLKPLPVAVPERPEGGRDIGPHIQHLEAKDGAGRILRPIALTMENGVDPANPNRTARRARRTDPLQVLYRAGTVSGRGLDAGEMLRDFMEKTEPSLSGSARSEIHVAAFLRVAMNDQQLTAATTTRRALKRLSAPQRVAVAWVCCGGTMDGLRAYRRQRRIVAAEDVKAGLELLADHFFGTRPREAA